MDTVKSTVRELTKEELRLVVGGLEPDVNCTERRKQPPPPPAPQPKSLTVGF